MTVGKTPHDRADELLIWALASEAAEHGRTWFPDLGEGPVRVRLRGMQPRARLAERWLWRREKRSGSPSRLLQQGSRSAGRHTLRLDVLTGMAAAIMAAAVPPRTEVQLRNDYAAAIRYASIGGHEQIRLRSP